MAGCLAAGRRTHLGQAGSKEHTLKELPHPLEELVHVRPLQYIHLQWEETRAVSQSSQRWPGPWEEPPRGRPPDARPMHDLLKLALGSASQCRQPSQREREAGRVGKGLEDLRSQ